MGPRRHHATADDREGNPAMNCEDARPLLVSKAHGDLSPSDEPAVGEHLASCAECRAAESDYAKVRALLHSAGRRDADGELGSPEPAGILRVVVQALLDRKVDAPGSEPAPAPAAHTTSPADASSPAATATLVPSPPRSGARIRRLLGLTAGLAVAAFLAIPRRPSDGLEGLPDRNRRSANPVRVAEVLDRDRLLAGPVRRSEER